MTLNTRGILTVLASQILDRDDGRTYVVVEESEPMPDATDMAELLSDVEPMLVDVPKSPPHDVPQNRHQRRAEAAIARRRGAR